MNREIIQVLDNYRLLELIGQGGMSSVYKALDTRSQRAVAIKLMHSHLADQPDFQRRFVEEGRAIAALDHPHILKVYEVALRESQLFLVMEYIEGGTLRHYLSAHLGEGKYLDFRSIASIMRQVAEALHYAHQQGIIHRDVKPDNVLLRSEGEAGSDPLGFKAVLSDFGLAKRLDGDGLMTASGELLGTLAYMAPEQFRGETIDARCDVYSLGVMLYELVSGRPPFASSSAVDLILMHTQGEPERITDLRPDTPPALVSIIYRSMLKNPKDRYQTAGEIARELEALEKSIKPLTEAKTWRKPRAAEPVAGPATLYDILPALDRPAIPVDLFTEDVADDIIIVTPADGAPWHLPFEKPSITVGRDSTCNLQLDDPRVSRKHMRIDRLPDGHIIVADLGSLNGLFVGDEKLGKNMMAEWPSSESVKVGPFWLTLRIAKSSFGVGRRLALNAPSSVETRIGHQDAVLRLSPVEAVVEPGGVVIVRIEVINNGNDAQYYKLSVKGIEPDWFTIAPFPLFVPQGARAERSITFHPPRVPTSTATNYDYVLSITPTLYERQVTSLNAALQVVPYYDFDNEVITDRKGFKIVITNRGNSQRYYVVEMRERQNALNLLPSRVRTLIQPGQSVTQEVKVLAKRRPLFGLMQREPIEVFIRTDGLRPKTQTFEYALRPRVSWEVVLMILLVLGLFLLLVHG